MMGTCRDSSGMATKGRCQLRFHKDLQPRRLLQRPDFRHQSPKVKRCSRQNTRGKTLTFRVEQQQLGVCDATQFGAELNRNRPANWLVGPLGKQGALGYEHQYGRGPKTIFASYAAR